MTQVKEMTILPTKALGSIEIRPEQIIRFPDGLFGFNECTEFALLEESEDAHFKWLQSTTDPNVAFIINQPELFMRDPYRAVVSSADLSLLQVKRTEDCLIFVIVTIPHDQPDKMTANLQGPVLINRDSRTGRQVISASDAHPVRFGILDNLED